MERCGLVYKHSSDDGHYALSSTATVSITTLNKPVPVQNVIGSASLTAFEGRSTLLANGWAAVEHAYDCSVKNHKMMRYQCSEYYKLLINNYNKVNELTQNRCFAHSQKQHYYQVIDFLCSVEPFVATTYVPLNLNADFYSRFCSFLSGSTFSVTLCVCMAYALPKQSKVCLFSLIAGDSTDDPRQNLPANVRTTPSAKPKVKPTSDGANSDSKQPKLLVLVCSEKVFFDTLELYIFT